MNKKDCVPIYIHTTYIHIHIHTQTKHAYIRDLFLDFRGGISAEPSCACVSVVGFFSSPFVACSVDAGDEVLFVYVCVYICM